MDFSMLYVASGNKIKADSLIIPSRKSEIGYIQKGNLTWEELSVKKNEYRKKGEYELAIGYLEMALKKAEIEFGKEHLIMLECWATWYPYKIQWAIM